MVTSGLTQVNMVVYGLLFLFIVLSDVPDWQLLICTFKLFS
jgi:hypothetical protein